MNKNLRGWRLGLGLAVGVIATQVQAGLQWISTSVDGLAITNGYAPQLTSDGRFVLFSNVSDDRGMQLLLKDRVTGTVQVVTRNTAGELMNQPQSVVRLADPIFSAGVVSDDGRFAVFESTATNLVQGVSGRRWRIYLRDLMDQTTTLIGSVSDGIAYEPLADRWLQRIIYRRSGPGATQYDVFLYERDTGESRLLLQQPFTDIGGYAISRDGRYVVFGLSANGLVPEDQDQQHDVFRLELETGQIVRVSVDAQGAPSGGINLLAKVSDDGSRVVFQSYGRNWLPGGFGPQANGFVKDLNTGALTLVNVQDGVAVGDMLNDFTISGDGSTVAFRGRGAATSGENGRFHIYRRRLDEPAPHMVDVNGAGFSSNDECHIGGQVQPILSNGTQHNPSLSADGLRIAFSCTASNLLPGVDGTHVYVRSYAGTPNSALPIPSQGAWGLSLLVAGVAGLGLWSVRRGFVEVQ